MSSQVTLALAAVLGVVLYRMSVLAALSVYGDEVNNSNAILFTTATAASINLICIFFFNWVRNLNIFRLYIIYLLNNYTLYKIRAIICCKIYLYK